MRTVLSVADEVLRISKKKSQSLTPMQLMKLTYIAYGWYMANGLGRLFPEPIEAWKYGPVMPDLYRATKRWGRNPIPLNMIADELGAVDDKTSEFLSEVVDKYGHLSGIALSSLTHRAGSPWYQVYRPDVTNETIPDNLIHDHYLKMLNDARNTAAA